MEKFILVGFREMPEDPPVFLKEFRNGRPNGRGIFGKAGNSPANGAIFALLGFSSSNLKISYSEGLENLMTFESENEASFVQRALNMGFHGRHNSWCVRKFNKHTTVRLLLKEYLKSNSHIAKYARYLSEMGEE